VQPEQGEPESGGADRDNEDHKPDHERELAADPARAAEKNNDSSTIGPTRSCARVLCDASR
jgi:hypothetical protein